MNDRGLPWFERWPDLEQWELARFAARELPAEVDEGSRAAGQLVVHTRVAFRGDEVAVRVKYPSEYPELPPVAFGPPGLLDRHQHLFRGNFCLLERPLDDWKAQREGAADLIASQLLPLLADTEAGPDAVASAEAPMPEPVSTYFNTERSCAVLLPGELATPAGERGRLGVAIVTPYLWRVDAVDDATSASLDAALPANARFQGRWRRLEAPPGGGGEGPGVAEWVRREHRDVLAPSAPRKLVRSGRVPAPPPVELVGFVFPEEGPGVGETRDAWLFLCIDRRNGKPRELLFHAQVVSPEERGRRIPELRGLNESRVLVSGLGTLGADVGVELAKAGVGGLDLLDFDRFEANNTVRHPVGLDLVGLTKTQAVEVACRRANPFCDAVGHELCFGASDWEPGESPLERLVELLDGADLVVEATGSHQVAQFVNRIAGEAGVPVVAGWMTDGAWGAEVVRIRPARTQCWTCFATDHREGRLPLAERGPESQVAVQGCSHPTTAGAGFDAAETAALMTRLAVATLAPAGGHPDMPWDYAAVSFRRAPDDAEYPRMAAESLAAPNEECEQCRVAAGSTAAP